MEHAERPPSAVLGWFGFLLGALALLAAVAIFWAGPFAPQQEASVSLGEFAADMGKAAIRSVAGQPQPEPAPVPRDIDDYLMLGVAIAGGLGIILAAAGAIRHEPLRPAIAAAVLGAGAIFFQLFTWAVLAILGTLLIVALIHSMGDFFSDLFSG